MSKLYMEITQDQYALPVCVCDTVAELARKTGLTQNNIKSQISKGNAGRYRFPRFVSILLESESKT